MEKNKFIQLNKNIDLFEKANLNYIRDNFLYNYLAHYFFCKYNFNLLFDTDTYHIIISSALDIFSINFDVCKEKIEEILKEKYNLIIISYNQLQIIKVLD